MSVQEPKSGEDHWLDRPKNIRLLIAVGLAALALSVLAGLFYEDHPHFGVDGWFGFYAWYGFLTCVAMVLGAKLLGLWVKRPDDYYDDE
jgi:hypothetical protein